MAESMWTHENESIEFKKGFRSGLLHSIDELKLLNKDVKGDGKFMESLWIELCEEQLEDELSMYEVGDE